MPLLTLFCGPVIPARAQSERANAENVVIAPGKVEPVGGVMLLGAAASGTVAELPVRAGDQVTAGQVLVRLACSPLESEAQAKAAQLAAAQAVLNRLQEGATQEDIAAGTAETKLAEARALEAGAVLRRARANEGETTSEAEVAQAQRDADVAADQLTAAQARLAALRAGSRPEAVQEAQSLRDAAKAGAAAATARLETCTVRAPQDGLILATDVTLGQFVSAAVPQPLLEMSGSAAREIRAEVGERDLGKICLDQHAIVSAAAFPGISVPAMTRRLGQMMVPSTLTADAAGKGSGDVREVILTPTEDMPNWPVGLRLSVRFASCPTTQPATDLSPSPAGTTATARPKR